MLIAHTCNTSYFRSWAGRSQVQDHSGQLSSTLAQKAKAKKEKENKRLEMCSVMECLHSMYEALGSTPSTANKKTKYIM